MYWHIAKGIEKELGGLYKNRITCVCIIVAINIGICRIEISEGLMLDTLIESTSTDVFFGKRIARIPYLDVFLISNLETNSKISNNI